MKKSTLALAGMMAAVSATASAPVAFAKTMTQAEMIQACGGCHGCHGCDGCHGCGGCHGCHGH